MTGASAFSPDYASARARFLASARARGGRMESYPIGLVGPDGEELAIDVATFGAERPMRVVVVSSGLHGVEGFLGSAIQVALLEHHPGLLALPRGLALVLIHALDPYGFAWTRRADEVNIDLNRNFLVNGEGYTGCSPEYAALDYLLNPPYPPSWLDPFVPRALWANWKYGEAELRQAVAGGQYDFPRGLFFGGHEPSRTRKVLEAYLPRWIGDAEVVLHLDVHTGLGRWGTVKLLVDDVVTLPRVEWLARRFGEGLVELGDINGISYRARGSFGTWAQATFPERRYDLLCTEFGTYSGLRVIAALRAENQAHHWGQPEAPATQLAKARLREVFAPADSHWRDVTVGLGLDLVRRAIAACGEPRTIAEAGRL
ncbi:MAG: DUF2817 domain-containing protein [Isosphaeraceae bacterium]|nr:DUF2817 domain-containing protein [Isosphaeraceae bacterium]